MYKRNKITKEVAQCRADEKESGFIILEWEKASSPARLKCKNCGCEFSISQGGRVYSDKMDECFRCLYTEYFEQFET